MKTLYLKYNKGVDILSANKKKTNIKRIAILIVIIILSVCLSLETGKTIYVQSHKKEATEYIKEKYGFEEQDIKLTNYKGSRFHVQEGEVIPFDWYGSNECWELKYQNKPFSIIRDKEQGNQLGDNYQLEDIFNWSVNYLKKNVSEKIIGIRIEPYTYFDTFTNETIRSYFDSIDDLIIYYEVSNINEYYDSAKGVLKSEYYNLKNQITNSCESVIGKKNITLYLLDKQIPFERRQVVTNKSPYLYCYDITDGSKKLKDELIIVGE